MSQNFTNKTENKEKDVVHLTLLDFLMPMIEFLFFINGNSFLSWFSTYVTLYKGQYLQCEYFEEIVWHFQF